MSDFNNINKMRFWSQKILPLVYDNSLSYYEVLCKVVNYLNKVIDDVNQIPDFIKEYVDEQLTDERIVNILYEFIKQVEDGITENNEGESATSSKDYTTGAVLWWNNKLYKVLRDISVGSAFVDTGDNPNIELINFDTMFEEFKNVVKDFITPLDDAGNSTASANRNIGQLIWLDNKLYEVIKNITQGNAYIYSGENQNVELVTLNSLFNKVSNSFTVYNEGTNDTASRNYSVDELLWLNNVLYVTTDNININESFTDKITTTNLNTLYNKLANKINNYKIINVLDYGVKGDGVTDDTDAINDCIEQFANIGYVPFDERKSGVIIYFPSGRYRVSDSIILYPFIHLKGAGVHSTEILFTDTADVDSVMFKTYNYDEFVENRDTFYNPQGVPTDFSVEEMSLYGSSTTVLNGSCFNIYGYNFRLENLEIYYFGGDGLYVDYDTNYHDYYWMDDTKFYESILNNVYIRQCNYRGIEWHGLTDAVWNNVNVSECNADVAVEIYAPIYINSLHTYGNGTSDIDSTGVAIHSNMYANLITSESNTDKGVIITDNVSNVTIDTLEVYNNTGTDFGINPGGVNVLIGTLLCTRYNSGNAIVISNNSTIINSAIIRGQNTTGANGIYLSNTCALKLTNCSIIDFSDGKGLLLSQGGANTNCIIDCIIQNCGVAIEPGSGLSHNNNLLVTIIKTNAQTSFSWALTYEDDNIILIKLLNDSTWSVAINHYPPMENELQLGSNSQINAYVSGAWQGLPFMRYASNHYEYYDAGTGTWVEKYPTGYVGFDSNSNHLVYWDGTNWTQVPNL